MAEKLIPNITTNSVADLRAILDEYGVAILENYFEDKYADTVFNSMVKWMVELDIGLTLDTKTWKNSNLPMGPRYGMYQSIVSNAPVFWELREKFYPIFSELLGETELITSIDGASIFPTIHSPKGKPDWAHIDQTISSDFMCYQAQFVSSDTTASFVCTPGSHSEHKNLLKKFGISGSGNWYKFTDDNIVELRQIFGGTYQIPIIAPKGSVIFWDSRTIHSAKYPDIKENNWRSVFYISMRPKSSHSDESLATIQKAVREGLTTNHWGGKIFKPVDRFNQKNSKVKTLTANPQSLSIYRTLNPLQRKLCGFDDWKMVLTLEPEDNMRDECLYILDLCDNLKPYQKQELGLFIKSTNKFNLKKLLSMLVKFYCGRNEIATIMNFIKDQEKEKVMVEV